MIQSKENIEVMAVTYLNEMDSSEYIEDIEKYKIFSKGFKQGFRGGASWIQGALLESANLDDDVKFEEWVFDVYFGDAELYLKHQAYMRLAFEACRNMKNLQIQKIIQEKDKEIKELKKELCRVRLECLKGVLKLEDHYRKGGRITSSQEYKKLISEIELAELEYKKFLNPQPPRNK
jgi:hypothetical protein